MRLRRLLRAGLELQRRARLPRLPKTDLALLNHMRRRRLQRAGLVLLKHMRLPGLRRVGLRHVLRRTRPPRRRRAGQHHGPRRMRLERLSLSPLLRGRSLRHDRKLRLDLSQSLRARRVRPARQPMRRLLLHLIRRAILLPRQKNPGASSNGFARVGRPGRVLRPLFCELQVSEIAGLVAKL